MDKLWLLVLATILCFLYSVFSAVDNPVIYKKVGDDVVLSPGSKVGKISSMTWKHGSDTVVDLVQGKSKFYDTFKGRCELNPTTLELTISHLTLEDSGSYTPEINNEVLDPINMNVTSVGNQDDFSSSRNVSLTDNTENQNSSSLTAILTLVGVVGVVVVVVVVGLFWCKLKGRQEKAAKNQTDPKDGYVIVRESFV